MVDKILNFNVGVLGHVDSGKTSLVKALSTVASTASFDKNPQSRERGITLDLGFSSFSLDIPEHLADTEFNKLQYTLVDCPGHASLIRTIIGGAQIIDLMILVVDVTKGMQTQTAECLVIGQIACEKMLVVLNKIDLLSPEKKQASIDKMTKRILKTLEGTKFAGSPVIAVAAKPGGPESEESEVMGVSDLVDLLKSHTHRPHRSRSGPFIFSVDHCFSIRGQGTVMTGTVLNGTVGVNDAVEIPSLKVTKKVKSMQMFHKPVQEATQGDRVGICVTQFDPKLLERGLVCAPKALPTIWAAIIDIHKIPYYKQSVSSKGKYHITMGHETVMGKVQLFGLFEEESGMEREVFDMSKEYKFLDVLDGDLKAESTDGEPKPTAQFALLELEKPVTCAANCLVIGSKLDTDINANLCRIAFHGKLLVPMTDPKYHTSVLPQLKVYKNKLKEGVVERKVDEYTVVCKGLFKKESNIDAFVGLRVKLSTGEDGIIEGGFGQSGKFKVRLPGGLTESTNQILLASAKAKKSKGKKDSSADTEQDTTPITLSLAFKRYMHDAQKKMIQT